MSSTALNYECKIMPLGTFKTLYLAVSLSLGLLFAMIIIGVPFWLTGILFFGVMYFILYYLTNLASFTFSDTYLIRSQNKKMPLFTNLLEQKYSWNEVKSYKSGKDKGRYRGEFQFLEIFFKDGVKWSLTDVFGEKRTEFDAFLDYFTSKVNQVNEAKISSSDVYETNVDSEVAQDAKINLATKPPSIKPAIVRRKTFYDTVWAKIFTAVMIVFVGGIILFYIFNPGYFRFSSGVNLLIVLIPGVIYLANRVFLAKKKED